MKERGGRSGRSTFCRYTASLIRRQHSPLKLLARAVRALQHGSLGRVRVPSLAPWKDLRTGRSQRNQFPDRLDRPAAAPSPARSVMIFLNSRSVIPLLP
jgi:hypothetical protein